jgi:hypothetical protein
MNFIHLNRKFVGRAVAPSSAAGASVVSAEGNDRRGRKEEEECNH